jgi:DNA-binding transcriptional LysR family regulator
VRLLERTTHYVALTPAGAAFLVEARQTAAVPQYGDQVLAQRRSFAVQGARQRDDGVAGAPVSGHTRILPEQLSI